MMLRSSWTSLSTAPGLGCHTVRPVELRERLAHRADIRLYERCLSIANWLIFAAVDAEPRARTVADAVARSNAVQRPLYLADALADAIWLGLVPEQLPSERSLAPELHVSRATVALAYETLRERGIVDRERGSGTRVRRAAAHRVCADPLRCIRSFFAPY
jgi:hypothetical protein